MTADDQTHDEDNTPPPPPTLDITPLEAELRHHDTAAVLPHEDRHHLAALVKAGKELAAAHSDLSEDERRDALERAAFAEAALRTRAGWSPWQWTYLSTLRRSQGIVSVACRIMNISPHTVRKYAANDTSFAEALQEVQDAALDRIEGGLTVSATVGDERPIYQGGVLVGWERRKSERAATVLLGAARPAKYREAQPLTYTGPALPDPQAVADAMRRLAGLAGVDPAPLAIEVLAEDAGAPHPAQRGAGST